MSDDVRVPDGITPIQAWRLWELTPDGELLAPRQRTRLGYGWQQAMCLAGARHDAPFSTCRCGFYGLRSPLEAVRQGWGSSVSEYAITCSPERLVLGAVEFAGRVLEHPNGWRAERARIAGLVSNYAEPALDHDIRRACAVREITYHEPSLTADLIDAALPVLPPSDEGLLWSAQVQLYGYQRRWVQTQKRLAEALFEYYDEEILCTLVDHSSPSTSSSRWRMQQMFRAQIPRPGSILHHLSVS